MRLLSYNILRNKRDLEEMLTDIQDILNEGLYQDSTITSVPADTPSEGEGRLYSIGTDRRYYKFLNNSWCYAPLRNEQIGFGYVTETGSSTVTAVIPFPEAYDNPPAIFISYIGSRLVSDGTPTDPGWFTGALTLRFCVAYNSTATGFTMALENSTGGALDPTYNSGFVWRALII